MPEFTLDPRTTALVLIDLQRGITAMPAAPHSAGDVIANAARLARAMRKQHGTVVLVNVDPGPNRELSLRVVADQPRPTPTGGLPADWTQIVPELGPEPGDVLVTKHQPGAFFHTDLEVHLRRRGIRTIVLGGISTNIGVESTARVAYELGYDQVFVEDAMAARDADLHQHAVTRFFPTIGRVRATTAVLAALG
ncbi:MAG TPA: hydrolase [Gemmatimonadaceae bacterium]|jgi:nicotinamidase-related amidase|nr:hydrolase [Gemmatimonadaceae bacterium]